MEIQVIHEKIFQIRGNRVMLDFHLAELYQVETRVLNQAVKRNIKRFPDDFMFRLNKEEWETMNSSQSVMTPANRPKSALPYAFTEQGVAMLSSVLNSDKAIEVNIAIMRAFVLLRQYQMDYEELKHQIEKLEKEMNQQFEDIYQALDYLLDPPEPEKDQIGFKTDEESD
jgi:hypothetical protein